MIMPLLLATLAFAPTDGIKSIGNDGTIQSYEYSVAPDSPFMNGNLPRMGKDVEFLFQEPVDASNAERVIFEAQGMHVDDRFHKWAFELRPIIEDEEGERFYLMPQIVKMIVSSDPRFKGTATGITPGSWHRYTTGNWYSGEAGAASHGLYTVGGKTGNARPTGALKFLGFQLHVVREAPEGRPDVPGYTEKLAASKEPVAGTFKIANVRLVGEKLPFMEPFMFADNLCRDNGKYRFSATVVTDFQAEPHHGVDQTFDFSKGECRPLEIPTGPDGIYWINWSLSSISNAVATEIAAGSFRTQTLESKVKEPIGVADGNPIPEKLRVLHAGRGIYAKGEPFAMTVAGMKNCKVSYILEPYCTRDILAKGEVPADGQLSFARIPGICVYRLKLAREENGKTAETAEFLFGEKTDPNEEHQRPGRLITRHELKEKPFNRFTYFISTKNRGKHDFEWHANDFERFIKETRSWIQNVTFQTDLVDFEVLEGVYDFTMLDRMLDTAADWGLKLTLKLDHADWFAGQYRWNKYSFQYSFDNMVCGQDNPCGVFAATDKSLREFFLTATHTLYNRYKNHVAFQGYYVCQPASEFTVVDQPWIGSISGYSPEEERGFREFIKAKYGTLEALNAKWQKSFAKWEDIHSPRPNFKLGPTPDLSPAWVDFSRWKENVAQDWYVNLISGIREFDQDRVTIAYGCPSLKYADLLDFSHNGGNARMDSRGAYIEAWEKGNVGWITEPLHPQNWAAGHVPGAEGWTLDASVWTMLAQAGAGGANLHLYTYMDNGEKSHLGGVCAQDRMRRYLPLLDEIHDARIIQPESEIATYSGYDTLLLKHRAYFSHRLADLQRWLELVTGDGFIPSKLDDFPGRKFKLVLPNVMDEVISANAFSNIVRQVKDNGATCLMTVRTGHYVTEFGYDNEFPLLKAFGIPLPQSAWQTSGDFRAKVLSGNPLFDEDSSFDIQTLTKLRRETHDEKILAEFGSYPYRWIPETDYFGCYANEKPDRGQVIARFERTDGAAMTLHNVGNGKVILFWGLPAQSGNALKGMMAKAAAFAEIEPSKAEVSDWFEMHGDKSKRHYGFFFLETEYGTRKLVFPNCPDGTYFADDMVSDRKYGSYSGKYLREHGIDAKWEHGDSPLKAIRLIPATKSGWFGAYGVKE